MRVARAVLFGLAATLLAAALLAVESAFAEPRTTSIGTSQDGSPLTLYTLGDGPKPVLILGGQHGGPEANTVELVGGLLEYFAENSAELPSSIELDVLPIANPDGLATGSRQFVSGADPNRNWGGNDWRSDAFDSNAVFRVRLGGPQPFSQQQTRALADWVLAKRPAFIVNYHSAGGFMFGARDAAAGDLSSTYCDGNR